MATQFFPKGPDGYPIKEALQSPGILYSNDEYGQLRFSTDSSKELHWIQSMPVHLAGKQIKRGQPVSIGFIDEFDGAYVKVTGEPAVVPSNPRRHQIASGIALNPGSPSVVENFESDSTHILTDGQITYDKKDPRWTNPGSPTDPDPSPYYMPPWKNDGSGGIDFEWSYDDIGKPVYVDGRIGHEGQLTIKVEEAYADGANICSVGRLADAPRKVTTIVNGKDVIHDNTDDTKIVIDVQITGDARGLIDSTQFDVTIEEDAPPPVPKPGELPEDRPIIANTTSSDKLMCVKTYSKNGITYGKIIIADTDLSAENDGSPIGAFIAAPGMAYGGKTIVIHRLGIVEGNFPYTTTDVGRELLLSEGTISTTGSSSDYEYKCGVVLGPNRVLIDCRFMRLFKKFAPIGDMKPIYKSGNLPLKEYVEPGYMAIDPTDKWQIADPALITNIGPYFGLTAAIMYKNMASYYEDAACTQKIDLYATPLPAGSTHTDFPWTADDLLLANAFFQFEDVYYTIGGDSIGTMIKYAAEGAPDKLDVLWPYKTFVQTITGNTTGNCFTGSNVRLNITDLVNVGPNVTKDDNTWIVDDFEITMVIGSPGQNAGQYDYTQGTDIILSPGFYLKSVDEEITVDYWASPYNETHQPPFFDNDPSHFPLDQNGNPISFKINRKVDKICGYEWRISSTENGFGKDYYLEMITNPTQSEDAKDSNYVNPVDVLGVCFPPGVPLLDETPGTGWDRVLHATIIVRRRPTQYHDLYLNQLYENSTWNTNLWSDGNGTIGLQNLAFGPYDQNRSPLGDGWRYAHEFSIKEGGLVDISSVQDGSKMAAKVIEEHAFGNLPDGDPTKPDWVPQVLDQIYRVKGNENLIPIRLTYSFLNQRVSSNALMAFKYYSPDAAIYYIQNQSFFFDPEDVTMGPNGHRAAQSVYEIPIGLFNYKDDTPAQIDEGIRISPYATQVQAGENNTNNKNVASHNYYLTVNESRFIWPPAILQVINPSLLANEYFYTKEEVDAIEQDRKSAYGPNFKDQSVQSNIGLLTQATGEAHERLLRIERAIFGADADSIPGDKTQDIKNITNVYGNYLKGVTSYGAIRLTKALLDLSFIYPLDDEEEQTPFWSFWNNILNEVLGWNAKSAINEPYYGVFHKWVFNEGDVPPFTTSKTASGLLPKLDGSPGFESGNVSDVWFQTQFWLQDWRSSDDGITLNTESMTLGGADGKTLKHLNMAWMRADHIFLKRTQTADQYYWLDEEDWSKIKPTPIINFQLDDNPYKILYGDEACPFVTYSLTSKALGKSDWDKSLEASGQSETVPSQSVEGIINDYLVRTIAYRATFDKEFGTLKSGITMFSTVANYEGDGTQDDLKFVQSIAPKQVNFKLPALENANGTRYFNYKNSAYDENVFSSAFGFDVKGKFKVPGALVLKGIVGPELFEEYVAAYNQNVDYDRINIFDDRADNIKDTRIPLIGYSGTYVKPLTPATKFRKGAFVNDPAYWRATKWGTGAEVGPLPGIMRPNDDPRNSPNPERYILESVVDIPRSRTVNGAPRDDTSPDRAFVDLIFVPSYRTMKYQIAGTAPNKKHIQNGRGPVSHFEDYETLSQVPENLDDGNASIINVISGALASDPTTVNISSGAALKKGYGNYATIPNWAKDNNIPLGLTLPLNQSAFTYKELNVESELVPFVPRKVIPEPDIFDPNTGDLISTAYDDVIIKTKKVIISDYDDLEIPLKKVETDTTKSVNVNLKEIIVSQQKSTNYYPKEVIIGSTRDIDVNLKEIRVKDVKDELLSFTPVITGNTEFSGDVAASGSINFPTSYNAGKLSVSSSIVRAKIRIPGLNWATDHVEFDPTNLVGDEIPIELSDIEQFEITLDDLENQSGIIDVVGTSETDISGLIIDQVDITVPVPDEFEYTSNDDPTGEIRILGIPDSVKYGPNDESTGMFTVTGIPERFTYNNTDDPNGVLTISGIPDTFKHSNNIESGVTTVISGIIPSDLEYDPLQDDDTGNITAALKLARLTYTNTGGATYNPADLDISGMMLIPRATHTTSESEQMHDQSVTILKDAFDSEQVLSVEYPNTSKLDTGLKFVAGKTRPDGQLQDTNLKFDIINTDQITLDELMEEYRVKLGSVTGKYRLIYDNYISRDVPDERFENLTYDMSEPISSYPTATRDTVKLIVTKLEEIAASGFRSDFDRTDTKEQQLEVHIHGKTSGGIMPDQSIWVDTQNGEMYLKFTKHLDQIMKLAVKVPEYPIETQSGNSYLKRGDFPWWPWNQQQIGESLNYPITHLYGGMNKLLPDIFGSRASPTEGRTVENLAIAAGMESRLTDWYDKTIATAIAAGMPASLINLSETFLDAFLKHPAEEGTVIKAGMMFYKTSWTTAQTAASPLINDLEFVS
jgi:hypothetical protein